MMKKNHPKKGIMKEANIAMTMKSKRRVLFQTQKEKGK